MLWTGRLMTIGLGSAGARLCWEVSLVQTFIGPMSFLATKVARVIALVTQLRTGWPFWKHWTREWASLQVKEEGGAMESLVCTAGGHLPTPLASRYQVPARSQISA